MTATDQLAAIEGVAEWARQWRLNPNIDKSGTIYNVWFDPESSAVELNLNDIEALLALVREQAAVIAKLSDWAGKNRVGYYDEAQDDVVQILRAALTATEGAA